MLNKQNEKLLQELLKKYKQGIISGLYPGNNITFTPTGCRDKIISSTGGGAGGGIESIQEGDNITIDDTDPQNPIISATGGGSSALLPNGVKYLTESRDLQADDAGYILFLLSETEPVVLTIPEISPLQVGDNFEIILPESGDWQNSGFIWSGELIKPEITESVFFITTTFGGNPYSLPISTLFTEGKTAFKYLYDQLQNAIPLSGTVSGSPVTGDIEFSEGIGFKTANADNNEYNGITLNTGGLYLYTNQDNGAVTTSLQLQSSDRIFVTSNNPSFRGLAGEQDFTANITDLDYTQKIYVDEKVQNAIPLSGTVSGSPVTGDIEIDGSATNFELFSLEEDSNVKSYLHFEKLSDHVSMGVIDLDDNKETSIKLDVSGILLTAPVSSEGITGSNDFTANAKLNPNSYVQYAGLGYRGTATLSSGTVIVSTDKVKTGYKIYVSVNTPSGTLGFLSAPTGSIVDATSFVINSSNAGDNSTVNWWIAP